MKELQAIIEMLDRLIAKESQAQLSAGSERTEFIARGKEEAYQHVRNIINNVIADEALRADNSSSYNVLPDYTRLSEQYEDLRTHGTT